ncbi:polysaccharide biosynthesis/export family protein [Planktothrix sp. FACHB-1365]|uniref:polysaccharide biosynthesis/export family protein n=1 Tax=Planktothrix sp. FACHB-1365 TaxID=2692855 RepID=UPI001F548D48|nr:polysaccharide biosynthesis/export family protein [Planktothrix sp. FACHB-1365]
MTLLWGFPTQQQVLAQTVTLPEKCVLPQEIPSQPYPGGQLRPPVFPQPTWPQLIQLFEQAGNPILDRSGAIPPPIDNSFFKRLSENRGVNYRLGPGDQLYIDVFINGQRSNDLSVSTTTVTPDGAILLPLIGAIRVQDATLEQVQSTIVNRLNSYVKNPQVNLSLLTQRPVRVTITGEVARPGFYPLTSPELPVALTTAQGTTTAADLRMVKIRRALANGQVVETEVDLLTPLLLGVRPADVLLEDGDVIIVPSQEVRAYQGPTRNILETYSLAAAPTAVNVTIVGDVTRPGFYQLPPGGGQLATALQASGGARITSDLRSVLICRITVDGRLVEDIVDLYTPIKEATALPNVSLQNGDAIIIPKLKPDEKEGYDQRLIATSTLASPQIQVRILSYPINAVGAVVLPNGSSFIDALNSVPLNLADLQEVALIRYDPQTGKPTRQLLNGKNVLAGDATDNVLLQDNDVIVVNRNLVARVSYVLNNFTQPFRDILGFLLFFQQLQSGVENLFSPSGSSSGSSTKK